MYLRLTTVAAFVAVILTVAPAAFAQESGSFRALHSYQHTYITVDHGDRTFTGGIVNGTRTIIESSGGPFAAGAHSVSECLVFSRSADGGISLEAPCTDTDVSGDIMYTRAVRKQGDVTVGGGGEGVWELLGGTGAYRNITGSCSYDTEYIEGGFVVVLADCAWSRS